MRRFLLLPLAFIIPVAAHSGPGWGWNELDSREWRDASLDWAQDIHPDRPAETWLADAIVPPPREMWCVPDAEVLDTADNCDSYFALLDEWIADYLQLAVDEPIPVKALVFPNECPSSCFVE